MAMITMNSQPCELTEEEKKELEQAERLQVVYDDDSPKMTKDMLSQFQRMNSVVVPVSPEDSRKIKEFGKDYKRILGSLLSAALNDSELIKKCVS